MSKIPETNEMISQLDKPLWEAIFKHIRTNGHSFTREDMARFVVLVWDRIDFEKDKFGACGIFQLRLKRSVDFTFLMIKARYDKETRYDKNDVVYFNMEATCYLSSQQNEDKVLVDFLLFLNSQEKKWLSPFFNMRSFPVS